MRSRSQPIFCSIARKNSPVPTKSCQRASTSPRSNVPSALWTLTVRTASTYEASASARSCDNASIWSSTACAMSGACLVRDPIAPSSVCITTRARVFWSAASAASQPRIGATAASGSIPSASVVVSGTANSGDEANPRSVIICPRWGGTSAIAAGGTRSTTTATAALRSTALARYSHGTASAYRAALVTNSHRSAADNSCAASRRFSTTTESMSGASRMASPRGIVGSATRCRERVSWLATVDRIRPGRMRSSSNQRASSGWNTSTGDLVVGRITPGLVTTRPIREFTSVDLPAPVDPPTTASSGASMRCSRGST